jgi:hypothetical protein
MKIVIKKKYEIVRLENDVVISEIVFGMVHGQPYEGFQKISIYQFRFLIVGILHHKKKIL